MTGMSLAEAAVAYAEQGYFVLPLQPGGKAPRTRRGFHDATNDVDIVRRWWEEQPDSNIGIVPGFSGHVVVDVDGPEGEAIARDAGVFDVPTGATKTARGQHPWFVLPPDMHVGN